MKLRQQLSCCCHARSASICEHLGTCVTLHHLCCRCLTSPLASAAELQALSSLQDADNVTAAYHGIGTLAALKAHGHLQQKPPSELLEQIISLLQQLVDDQGRWANSGLGQLVGSREGVHLLRPAFQAVMTSHPN